MRARILSASAGAGKTYRLAYKFVHDVITDYPTKPYLYRAILAVTFTNKATAEMKGRIVEKINSLITEPDKSDYMKDLLRDTTLTKEEIISRARRIQTHILHDYSRFTILTIDKFFQRILRAFIKELGIDLNYNIELQPTNIISLSTDSLIEDISIDADLQKWIMEFARECIDEGLDWDIRKNIRSLAEEIFKERNRQTIEKSKPKEELLKIIRKAEARKVAVDKRLQEIGKRAMEIFTTQGICAEHLLGKNRGGIYPNIEKLSQCNIVRPGDSCRKAISYNQLYPAGTKENIRAIIDPVAPEILQLLREYCETYDSNIKFNTTLSFVKTTFRSFALLQDIYRKVQEHCETDSVMLLSETKHVLSRFISGNDTPFIYEKIGNRFERYMIDEFQDTSAKEWENFIPLLQNAMAQAEDESVLIVGDVKQSIYRWRGGDWRILHSGVKESFGEENARTEYMEENYRSLPQVVDFNNDIISKVVTADNGKLNAALKKAVEADTLSPQKARELAGTLEQAYFSHKQIAKRTNTLEKGYVRVELCEDKNYEIPIIRSIESAIARGYAYKDIMILCRTSATINKVADILLSYKQTNNAFNIMTQDALIVGKAAINQFVIALMHLSQNPRDKISVAIVNDYLSRSYAEAISEQEQEFLLQISQLTPEEAFEHIVVHYQLHKRNKEVAYLQALHEQIVSFCSSKVADIQLFLKEWDDEGRKQSLSVEMSDNTIEISTIHSAKGLEKKVVIMPCDWKLPPKSGNITWATPTNMDSALAEIGRFPIKFKEDLQNSAFADDYFQEIVYSHVDNINLLYVGLTRAKEELYVLIPKFSDKDSTKKEKDDIKIEIEISRLVWTQFSKDEIKTIEKEEDGNVGNQYIEYGTPIVHHSKSESTESRNILLDDYPTTLTQMSLRLPEQRYFEEEDATPSARNMGIMMHSILNEARDIDDIHTRIDKACKQGKFSEEQRQEMHSIIEREFCRAEVKEWFSDWDEVRNENDIISNHIIGTRRPDRVMIKGDRAVVVDYKFGLEKNRVHIRQIASYMELLKQMGYKQIEGYAWYLSLGEIVRVN